MYSSSSLVIRLAGVVALRLGRNLMHTTYTPYTLMTILTEHHATAQFSLS